MKTKPETARQWFEFAHLDDGLTRISEPHVDPFLRCNIWHVRGRDRDLLIDSGLGLAPLLPVVIGFAGREPLALATHTHFDHVGGMHEFETRMVHPLEAELLVHPPFASIRLEDYPHSIRAMFPDFAVGYEALSAYPSDGFDPASYRVLSSPATRCVEEGDVLDLGDRTLEVVHLPGHTPGSIGIWEAATGLLFSGDALYDGELLADLPESDRTAYAATMERLRAIPVRTVHGGHGESFGPERCLELIDSYVNSPAS